jgi:hypothetical protein
MLKSLVTWLTVIETRFFEAYLGFILLSWFLAFAVNAVFVPHPWLLHVMQETMPRWWWMLFTAGLGSAKLAGAMTNRLAVRKWASFFATWFWGYLWFVACLDPRFTNQKFSLAVTVVASATAFLHTSLLLTPKKKTTNQNDLVQPS